MAAKIRVGIVFGGRSGEHEISLISAQSVMDALDRTKYQVVPLGITKEGKWLPSGDPMRRLKTLAKQGAALPEPHSETTQGQVAPSHDLVPGIGGRAFRTWMSFSLCCTARMARMGRYRGYSRWRTCLMWERACWAPRSVWTRQQ